MQAVIDKLEKPARIDSTRIFLMGMSNGGIMSFRLAQELRTPIAGFAAICSSMSLELLAAKPRHKTSVLIVAGTADSFVPYGGGPVMFRGQKRGPVAAVEDAVNYWIKSDDLPNKPAEKLIPANGPTHATQYTYGRGTLQVELIKVEGGGHAEPSKVHNLGPEYQRLVGEQNHDFETAEVAWEFFRDKRAL